MLVPALPAGPASPAADTVCDLPAEDRQDQPEPVEVCAATTVTGQGGSTVRVRFPADAVIDLWVGDQFRHLDLDGAGPAIGFVLTDNVGVDAGGSYVMGVRLGVGHYKDIQDYGIGSRFPNLGQKRYLIPAGEYSLYLFGSGPVTVELPFEGLDGSNSIETVRTISSRVETLESRAPDPADTGQANLYSVGTSARLGTGGLLFLAVESFYEVTEPTITDGYCWYHGIPSNEDAAYWPYCPARWTDGLSAEDANFGLISGPVHGDAYPWFIHGSHTGDRAVGYWRVATTPLATMSAVAVVVNYEPPATG